ncbi:MAG: GNAT family N-acetyltransferase [Fimbriimonas sp.]
MKTGTTIRRLSAEDTSLFRSVLRLFEDAFDGPSGADLPEDYLHSLLQGRTLSVFVSLQENRVIGALTAYLMPSYYSKKPFLYLMDIAVAEPHQRQGVGSGLLAALLEYGREVGADEMFVQADLEDTHAIDFYHKNGGEAASVVHFTYPL